MGIHLPSRSSVVWFSSLLGIAGVAAGCPTDPGGDDGGFSTDGESCEQIRQEQDALPVTPGCFGASLSGNAFVDMNGIRTPPRVTETDPARVGEWSALADSAGHLAIHAVHRPTGKFMMAGLDNHDGPSEYDSDKLVWYPPEPCTPLDLDPGQSCDIRFDLDPFEAGNQDQVDVPLPDADLFCSAHVNLPPIDGAEFVNPQTAVFGGQRVPPDGANGGNNGATTAVSLREDLPFVPPVVEDDAAWIPRADMQSLRWYPTATTLSDGRVIVTGGLANTIPNGPGAGDNEEIYAASAEIMSRTPAGDFSWAPEDGVALSGRTYSYPFMFVLPDLPHFEDKGWNLGGKLLYAGFDGAGQIEDHRARIYDHTTTPHQLLDIGGKSCTPGSSAVMYEPGKVLKFGGTGAYGFGSTGDGVFGVSRTTEVLDLTDATVNVPEWRRTPPISMGKRYSSAVLLPTGGVLSTGGGSSSGTVGDFNEPPNANDPGNDPDERHHALFVTDLFDPTPGEESWCRVADAPEDPQAPGFGLYRGYHSQSFLLPDGRVYLGAGGNRFAVGQEDHFNHQFFSPPYLFWGPRPEVTLPSNPVPVMTTGATFEFDFNPAGPPIERVTLLKLASATHAWDMEQRFLELDIIDIDDVAGVVTVDAPPSTCYATPGPYMIFAISEATAPMQGGVPSIGQYVQVTGTCAAATAPVDPPEEPAAAPGGENTFAGGRVHASCGAAPGTLELSDFGRSVKQLCDAAGGCPSSGTVALSARLVSSSTQSVPPGGTLLDQATLVFGSTGPVFTDPLRLDVSGTAYTPSLDLGPGTHGVELCSTLAGVTGCYVQQMSIGPQLVGPNTSGYRAATIESRFIRLQGMQESREWQPTNDGVVTVDFPRGFTFPYFGTSHSRVYVGANGGVRFTTGTIPATNTTLPTSSGNNGPHIAALWDDWQPATSGVVMTRRVGSTFVISWERIAHQNRGGAQSADFQLHLHADGRVELHFADSVVGNTTIDNGKSATVGMQRPNGTQALVVGFNNSTWLGAGNRALAFDTNSCIATPLRLPASRHCNFVIDRPSLTTVDVCTSPAVVAVPVPDLPTTCGVDHRGTVDGRVRVGTTKVPINEGLVTLPTGTYTVEWEGSMPEVSPAGTVARRFSKTFTQSLRVRLTTNPAICCSSCTQSFSLSNSGEMFDLGAPATAVVLDGVAEGESAGANVEVTSQVEPAVDLEGSEQAFSACAMANAGDDFLIGTADDEIVLGGEGADLIEVDDGDDLVHAEGGDDVVAGEGGNDRLFGGDGSDHLDGGDGEDTLWGGAGNDALEGSHGADMLLPGSGTDVVQGGEGDDRLVILDGCELAQGEVFDGGPGLDVLVLPPDVSLQELDAWGISVVGVEAIEVLLEGTYGESDCAAPVEVAAAEGAQAQ